MSSTKRTKRDVNRAALQVAEHLEKKFKLMLDNEELPSGVKKEDVEMHLRAKLNEKAPMVSIGHSSLSFAWIEFFELQRHVMANYASLSSS